MGRQWVNWGGGGAPRCCSVHSGGAQGSSVSFGVFQFIRGVPKSLCAFMGRQWFIRVSLCSFWGRLGVVGFIGGRSVRSGGGGGLCVGGLILGDLVHWRGV